MQDYYYFTVTEKFSNQIGKHDAHELKKDLSLYNLKAWNKGECIEAHPYLKEVDVFYGISVTGQMIENYELSISSETIRKLAEMRLSLDFDMYF